MELKAVDSQQRHPRFSIIGQYSSVTMISISIHYFTTTLTGVLVIRCDLASHYKGVEEIGSLLMCIAWARGEVLILD